MNYSYQKLPIVVEAFQMTLTHRWNNYYWPGWLLEAWNLEGMGSLKIDPSDTTDNTLLIKTLEGVLTVSLDDWIIRGVEGEIYPCKPDIFRVTYRENFV